MILQLIEELGPEFWSAYAAVLRERDRLGTWPSVKDTPALALNHGCDPWALLALTRQELPEVEHCKPHRLLGGMAPLSNPHSHTGRPSVLAPTPTCLAALQLIADRLYAYVIDPWAREVHPRDLGRYADNWREALNRKSPLSRLAPYKVEPPSLGLGLRH